MGAGSEMLMWLFGGSKVNSSLGLFCKKAFSIFCVVVDVNKGRMAIRVRTTFTTHQIIA